MKRKSEAIFFRKYLLRINRLINQEHIWCFTGLIKLLSVKKDTQKYGNADGRNILCRNAPEKAFPYFFICFRNNEVIFLSRVSSWHLYHSYRKIIISFSFETTESVIVVLYTAERIRISRQKTYIFYSDRR